jgi:putative acetyltransferase
VTFFERLGYEQTSRNSVPIAEQWLSNTTMKKRLTPSKDTSAPPAKHS